MSAATEHFWKDKIRKHLHTHFKGAVPTDFPQAEEHRLSQTEWNFSWVLDPGADNKHALTTVSI